MSKYYYLNHEGKGVDLCKSPIFVENFRELRSYAWNVSTLNGRLTRFSRKKFVKYKLSICIYADRDHIAECKDYLLRITETDVRANEPGRLYINGYFCEGYLFAEDISDYEPDGGLCASSLYFLAPKAEWICEKQSFEFADAGIIIRDNVDHKDVIDEPAPFIIIDEPVGINIQDQSAEGSNYPFVPFEVDYNGAQRILLQNGSPVETEVVDVLPDSSEENTILYLVGEGRYIYSGYEWKQLSKDDNTFPFGYPSATTRSTIVNESVSASAFILTIYGNCTNPSIVINGHTYNVNANIPSGGILVIDSRCRSIILTHEDGTKDDLFGDRNHDDDKYIFEPIPIGELTITYENVERFIMTIVDERSNPPWI